MYTVIRFSVPDASLLEKAKEIGNDLNKVIPGTYDGIRRAGDGFACDVSRKDTWDDHVQDMIVFLKQFEGQIEDAIKSGLFVTVDVAIHQDDVNTMLACFRLEADFFSIFGDRKVALEISLYGFDKN